jgi:hypothetical protein
MEKILNYNVMSLPALVIDEKVVAKGRISENDVKRLLSDKSKRYMKRFVLLTLVALLCLGGAAFAQKKRVVKKASPKSIVEVLYFHGKQSCPTCIAIGDNSKDVVYKDFSNQVKGWTSEDSKK